MKYVILFALSLNVAHAFELPKMKVADIKKKACPMINGKEDCSANEVKDKAMELKKKFLK